MLVATKIPQPVVTFKKEATIFELLQIISIDVALAGLHTGYKIRKKINILVFLVHLPTYI